MSAVTGRVFVAQNPEQFTYDADGNMTCDGRFRYTWNAENRLVRAQELCAPTNRNPYTVAYAYDHKGRMVSKRITENDGHDTLVKSIAYVWDGWNIIREIVRDGGESATVTDNIWGLDLDGTLQGAGGVGGLLAVQRSDCATTNSAFCILHSALYLPTYDANGNVSEYVTTNGEIVAHYDYSPFGETLIESGDLASTFTHRFSTKPWCPITGLYEYQMRKYRPEIGRWLSRDPLCIKAFQMHFMRKLRTKVSDHTLNKTVYLFIGNNVENYVDLLGLCTIEVRYNLLGSIFWIRWYHAYVVVTDIDGKQTYYRGGPSKGGPSLGVVSSGAGGSASDSSGSDEIGGISESSGSNSSGSSNGSSPGSSPGGMNHYGPWGPIETRTGEYKIGTIDFNPTPVPKVLVLNNSEPCACYKQKLDDALKRIQKAKIPYNPFGDNSNATAHQIIEDSGFPRPKPPVWAPGSGNVL